MAACLRERERERQTDRQTETETDRKNVCESVLCECECVSVCVPISLCLEYGGLRFDKSRRLRTDPHQMRGSQQGTQTAFLCTVTSESGGLCRVNVDKLLVLTLVKTWPFLFCVCQDVV